MKTFISIVLFSFIAVSGTSAQAQKIGYVNSNKIFQELPEAQDAQKKIDAMAKPIQDQIESKEKELQGKYEDYQKKKSMMTESAKKAAEEEIMNLEQQYRAFRTEKLGNDGDLAKETEKIVAPLKAKILGGIERVAKEEKYTFVFDKTDQVNVLLFGDAAHDLTFKVIDRLKRGK